MSDIAELTVRIKADAAQLSAEMKKVQNIVQQSSNSMSSSLGGLKSQLLSLAPAISAVAFVNFAKGAFEAADRLNDLSQRTGVAASTLSALNIPLLQGGSNVEEFAGSINRMNNMIGEAAKGGSQDLLDTFDKLGLSVKKLMQLSPEEQFFKIAQALNKIKNQAEFTNTGMDIFGRSFSSLAPLIRSANGNLAEFVKKMQEQGSSLTKEQLDRIADFGDKWTYAWEHAKLGAVDFLTQLLKISDWIANQPNPSGALLLARTGIPPVPHGTVSDKNPGTIVSYEKFGPQPQTEKERNDDLRKIEERKKAIEEAIRTQKEAQKSLDDYTLSLIRMKEAAGKTPQEQAGMEAYYKTLDLAKKAHIKNIEKEAAKNKELAESNYAIKEAQDEARRSAIELTDKLSDGLTNAIMDFNNAGDAAKNFARAIASMIVQQKIASPLANALTGGASGGGGLIGSLFKNIGLPSFDVGSPYVPNDMIAQIHKGEIIIPKIQADAIRSGSGGGSGVTVVQNINIASGVTRQEVASMLPAVAQAAHDAVFASIQRGGSAARIVGIR